MLRQEIPSYLLLEDAILSGPMNFYGKSHKLIQNDYILLVMDNAIWHKSSTLEIPSNIELAFIPPYIPEMNPIEQVWKEIRKRGFKNKSFQSY